MEKVTFQNSEGLKLIGILHIPKDKTTSAIIISPGFTANKNRQRFIALSEALSNEGFAVLRFDFGGCGESEDREITLKHQVNDLKSAIKYLKDKGYENIGLLGASLGGLISVLCYDEQIKSIVLWAPVTKAKTPLLIQKQELEQELTDKSYVMELSDKGYVIYQKEGREFKIPQEYFNERQAVNQEEILSGIGCPVLIIHGNKDDIIPLEEARSAAQFLNKESRLEIIEEGDHILGAKMDEVIPLSVDWFKKYVA